MKYRELPTDEDRDHFTAVLKSGHAVLLFLAVPPNRGPGPNDPCSKAEREAVAQGHIYAPLCALVNDEKKGECVTTQLFSMSFPPDISEQDLARGMNILFTHGLKRFGEEHPEVTIDLSATRCYAPESCQHVAQSFVDEVDRVITGAVDRALLRAARGEGDVQ